MQPNNLSKEQVRNIRSIISFVTRNDDEDMSHMEPQARYQVPVGPVTRARARRFKEELNNLIVKLQDEEGDKLAKERIQGSQEAPMKSVIWAELN